MGTWRLYDVSIPFISGNSFLHGAAARCWDGDWVCQSPSPRGTHFYPASPAQKDTPDSCLVSIPFTPGTHFYFALLFLCSCSKGSCVNPLHVGELISTKIMTEDCHRHGSVNPLHTGELISTTFLLSNQSPHNSGVNPLHTGELISTLTLIFCWFYAGFHPRFPRYFRDNSENGWFFGHFNNFKYFL